VGAAKCLGAHTMAFYMGTSAAREIGKPYSYHEIKRSLEFLLPFFSRKK
jgi:hypothetical protein